ncbi:hypothetical protein [Nesterenkonia sp.]|uniref:hypothetical protein n=1 Tax=Nesterenkonia sp. TaxID=704201 RepID=UPI002619001D|nr:hypothetical protein [Nesterenkonia sp.]
MPRTQSTYASRDVDELPAGKTLHRTPVGLGILAAGAVLLIFLVVGCSSQDASDSGEAAPTAETAAAPAPTPSPVAAQESEEARASSVRTPPEWATAEPDPDRPPGYIGVPEEAWVECTDPEAVAQREAHEPAGWPQEWDGEGMMPEPECHPDYVEIVTWEYYNKPCGCEDLLSTLAYPERLSEAELREALWEQSRARAEWTPPASG